MYDPWNDFSLSIGSFLPSRQFYATLHLWYAMCEILESWMLWSATKIFIWHQSEVNDGGFFIFIWKKDLNHHRHVIWSKQWVKFIIDYLIKAWEKFNVVTYFTTFFFTVCLLLVLNNYITIEVKILCKMFFQSFYCLYREKNDGCKAKVLLTEKGGKINPAILVLILS